MVKFAYKAKKGSDNTLEGIIEADSREEAFNKLLAQELFPINIVESCPQKTAAPKVAKKKLSSREILNFIQKLTILLRAKVELLSSLKILYEQAENAYLQQVIMEIYHSAREGKTFSESLALFPEVFSSLVINIIKAGEASGRLDFSLEQINEFMSREENLKNKISVALAYPALLLSVGIVSIFVLMNFVIPKLRPIFEGLGKELPLITKIILDISSVSHKAWLWILGLIIVLGWAAYKQKDTIYVNNIFRQIKLNLPLVKRLIRNQELAHFSRSLGLLIGSGIGALKSLEISSLMVSDQKLKQGLKDVYEDVASGHSLSKSMKAHTSLPDFIIKMIAVGEESGRLGEIFDEICHAYNQQIEVDIMLISSLLEPILILGLGVILGAIILSILLPTFQITQIVH